jgi:3-oxoacyl-[acyl-carrier-protein] synthase-3
MTLQPRVAITAVGGHVPETRLTNQDLEKMVDTQDEWIRTRTGIRERRILNEPGKATSDLIVPAVLELCKKRGIDPSEIECLIVATVTGDYPFPSTANLVCDRIGAKNAWGYDLSGACSGFLYALTTGAALIESGRYKKVVVVGADKMSSIIDYQDRNTCIIFGDGAGAVLLEPTDSGLGIGDSLLKSDGSGVKYLRTDAGGSLLPPSLETVQARQHFVKQEGAAVYKFAVKGMAEVTLELMERNQLRPEDITWLVPHQANIRIIESTADRAGIPMDRVMVNIEKFGNTTAATLPLCLWEWEPRLKKGDRLVLVAFGGGFTWGATLIDWAY